MHLVSANAGPGKVAAPSVLESHGSVRPLAAEDLERVAALFLTKFRRRRRHLLDRAIAETAEYMREIYLDPAGQSGASNALVQINRQGRLGGFLGVLKARYELNGAALNAAIIGPLMADPGTDDGSAGPQLLRALHQGEFDLQLTDSANRTSLAFARPMKYQLLPVHCLGWTCIFRPAAMAAATLHRKWPGLPRLALDPCARAFDALAKRRFELPVQASSSQRVHSEPITAAQFAERLPTLLSDYSLRPSWKDGELPRLLALAAEKRADGPLHFGGTYDETGKMLGCYAFYGQAGDIASLLQIQSSGSHWRTTLDGLIAAAWGMGCVGITGQTQSRFMPQLFGYKNLFFRYAGGRWSARELLRSRKQSAPVTSLSEGWWATAGPASVPMTSATDRLQRPVRRRHRPAALGHGGRRRTGAAYAPPEAHAAQSFHSSRHVLCLPGSAGARLVNHKSIRYAPLMTVTVRFAPSPTGRIHIGNARTALFNWLFAMNNKGRFIQRFDDTDIARSKQEFSDAILYDLHWLGIFPDATEYQSRRFEVYDAAVDRLKAAGVLYACYETPEELDLRRKVRRTRGLPPVYGREALALTQEQIDEYQADGRRPHWRFLLPNFSGDPQQPERTEIHWNDLVRGEETVDLASLSDPVLVREDGTYLYTLPSVVDDIEMGVSHVIRGDDHVTNTGVQIALFRALAAEPPVFGHHNLLTTASGEGLSKRTGALSIESLREDGIEPMAVASLAVLVGTSENVAAVPTMGELAERFDPAATSKSAAKFDPDELFVLNRTLLHHMPFAEAQDRLIVLGVSGEQAEPFWLAVRGNLDRLADAVNWWRILREGPQEKPEFSDDDRDFLGQAFDLLPEDPWTATIWKDWTGKIREATGRKGKALFMPLRTALTGLPSGPELADLLPLMGREGTLARRP